MAESLFREAREEMRRGDLDQACAMLAESYRLDPALGSLLNWGLCEQKRGHTATAWTKLRQFLDATPSNDPRLPMARKALRELEVALARVSVVIPPDAIEAQVTLDGVELRSASLGVPLPVDPGDHVVVLKLLNGETQETHFRLSVAEQREVLVELPPVAPLPVALPVAAQPALTPPPNLERRATAPRHLERVVLGPSTGRVAAYMFGAVGVSTLFVSGAFGILALKDKETVRAHCAESSCRDQIGLDAAESGARHTAGANIALGVATITLATGALLWWRSSGAGVSLVSGPNSASLSLVRVWQ